MERLWTPWRMQYVSGAESKPGCFLCEKPREDRDAENLILYRDPLVYAVLNLYPYNTAHTMIVPYAHTNDFGGLDPDTAAALTALTQRVVRVIAAEYHPDGFNVGMNLGRSAGAGVPDHLHIHVVPRWGGDTNFMTVTSNTKVLPETLERTYARLAPPLARNV